MYTPTQFAVDDEAVVAFLNTVRAADLVTMTADGLVATFLPMLFDSSAGEHGALLGHVARKNDQWHRDAVGNALVIVHAEDAYISPSWYPSKARHGRVVPTWNYRIAHVYGELVIHDDPAWVGGLVRRLTERHESPRAEPWSVDDAPPEFHAGRLRAIVGVEIQITRIEAKFKMSQNRADDDIDGVVAGLVADGQLEAAEAVRRNSGIRR